MTDKRIEELLPWLVNETLNRGESYQVEEYLTGAPEARDDVEFLRAVRKTLQDQPLRSPGELGLKRFQKQLAEKRRAAPKPKTWWRPALVAAALVIVAQGGLLVNLWRSETPGTYTPLGTAPTGAILQVELQETATAAAITEALDRAGVTIVDGPSTVGLYRLQVRSESELERALAVLSASTEVVKHVSKE